MAIQKYEADFEELDPKTLANWQNIPPAIVSDCMNRSNAMASRISPLSPGMHVAGQARTVTSMVGDNGASHVAIGLVTRGQILVIDGRAHLDTAVWGGVMTRAAIKQGLGGVVIDGAVRDAADIRELNFPTFASAIVPTGPSKGFGGIIDGPISCGGCPVLPGDLIIGDDDGVAVVPLKRQAELLKESISKMESEDAINRETESGNLPYKRFNIQVETIE